MKITQHLKATLSIFVGAFLVVHSATADIVSTSVEGDDIIDVLANAPADVTENQFTGDASSSVDIVRVFQEQAGLLLAQDVGVDIDPATFSLPRTFTGSSTVPPPEVAGTVPAGTRVDVFFLHLDEPTNELGRVAGTVTFDVDILGVITNSTTLANTHSQLGAPGTTYPGSPANHGTLEDSSDFITFIDNRTLDFQVTQQSGMDQFRVLTVVPVPAAVWLFGSALGLLGWLKRQLA